MTFQLLNGNPLPKFICFHSFICYHKQPEKHPGQISLTPFHRLRSETQWWQSTEMRQMARWLRMFAALPEAWSSVRSTQGRKFTRAYNSSSRVLAPYSGLSRYPQINAHWHTYTKTNNKQTNKKKPNQQTYFLNLEKQNLKLDMSSKGGVGKYSNTTSLTDRNIC